VEEEHPGGVVVELHRRVLGVEDGVPEDVDGAAVRGLGAHRREAVGDDGRRALVSARSRPIRHGALLDVVVVDVAGGQPVAGADPGTPDVPRHHVPAPVRSRVHVLGRSRRPRLVPGICR
jgi:hypothetical protein